MNYEIIALGDGNYVRAVLDAAASVSNYGTLGAVGMFIGLLLMAVKGMTDPGGPKLDLAPFAVSIVLFWVMFLIRVDEVVISEIMVQPGEVAPRSYVVDNVPFGLAGVGYAVSTVTNALTKQYETSFGSATDESRGTTGGLGQNLMRLTSFRTLLSNPDFTDPPVALGRGYISTYRENASHFAENCVIPLVNNGVLSRETLLQSPGVTGFLNDTTAHRVRTTRWIDRQGTESNRSCAEAKVDLEKTSASPDLARYFDEAAAAMGRKDVNSKQMLESFGVWTNTNAQSMQGMVAATVFHAVLREAAVRGSLSPADAQAIVMVEEAAAKRNVQAAAEESLFIRILRPTVGFFEAFFYALAPIMAIVCCMGRFGWNMIGKYLALPLWVGLWFPMLAIIQLYSNLQMEYFFDRLGDIGGDYSPMQLQQISTQAMDTLGAAATFTAATPAIAMSILFGGAVSMSYLAGRLQGSDMIDETKVAPNASSVSPIAQQGAVMESTLRGGHSTGGAGLTYSSGESVSNARALTQTASLQANSQFTQTLTNSEGQTVSFGVNGMSREGHVAGTNLSDTFNSTINDLRSQGKITNEQATAAKEAADGLQVHAGVGTPAKLVFDAGVTKQWASSEKLALAQGAVKAINDQIASSTGVGTAFAVAAAHDTQAAIGTSALKDFSESQQAQIAASSGDVISVGKAVTDTQTLQRSAGTNETVNLSQAAGNFSNQDLSDLRSKLIDLGVSAEEIDNRAADFANTHAGDPRARQLGAMIDIMQNGQFSAENQADRSELYTSTMGQVFASGGSNQPTFDTAGANSVVDRASAGAQFGGTEARVRNEIQAPANVDVAGEVGNRLDGYRAAVSEGAAALGQSDTAGAAGVAGVGGEPGGVTRESLDSAYDTRGNEIDQAFNGDVNNVKNNATVSPISRVMSTADSNLATAATAPAGMIAAGIANANKGNE